MNNGKKIYQVKIEEQEAMKHFAQRNSNFFFEQLPEGSQQFKFLYEISGFFSMDFCAVLLFYRENTEISIGFLKKVYKISTMLCSCQFLEA